MPGTEELKEFLEEVASKPQGVGKQLLGSRMRNFLGMPPADRKQAITALLDALGEVSEETRTRCVKYRTDIMLEIPKEHRQMLMSLLGEIMMTWSPERKAAERRAVMKATDDYFFLKKRMVRKRFGALLA